MVICNQDHFTDTIIYNGLAYFPTKEARRDPNKFFWELKSIEDAEAVMAASMLHWPGIKFKIVDENGKEIEDGG
jgi:hypothetical protein